MDVTRSSKRNRKRRLKKWVLLFLLLILGGASYYGYNIYSSAKSATKQIYKKLDTSILKNQREEEKIEVTKDPFTVLLAGVDTQGGGLGRSDVLILLAVNPQTKQIYQLSIPRDTRTYIPAADRETKITQSFSYKGIESTIGAVNELFDIPIDYYITTNFEGFEDIVDTVGGVTVDVPFTFKAQLTRSLKWKTYTEGPMKLNGNEALAYVRMRKSDPRGDFGRNERQKQVIKAVVDKGTSFSSLTKIDDILADLGKNVKTNIPPSKLLSFAKLYSQLKDNEINNLKLEGQDEWISDIYYYEPDQTSLDELNATFKNALKTGVASANEESTNP